jgi:hypothetical protein
MGEQNLGHGWSRMGVSLKVGLVFFVCEKRRSEKKRDWG